MKAMHILGIDIAKSKFDVTLRSVDDTQPRYRCTFENSRKGFKALVKWLKGHGVQQVHACLESTSRYGDALALFLYQQSHLVSLVNPRRTHNYAASRLVRTQNDRIDADLIADFCASEQDLALWEPLPPDHAQLRELIRLRQALATELDRHANRLECAAAEVRKSLQRQIERLRKEMKTLEKAMRKLVAQYPELKRQIDLADSVPAVAFITAATVVAELPPINKVPQARQAVALAGLDPTNKESGDTVRTKPRISRMGSPRLRKALYMAAVTALRCNPIIQALAERLRAKGKTGKCIVVAAMRKLLRLIYGVIKTGHPFDPAWATKKTEMVPA